MARVRFDEHVRPTVDGASSSRRAFIAGLAGVGLGDLAPRFAFADERADTKPDVARAPVVARRGVDAADRSGRIDSHVHVNQVGYLPNETKIAVVPATGPMANAAFAIIDDDVTPQTRYRGELTASGGAGGSGRYPVHYLARFDGLTRPGRYRVRLSDGRLSPPFSIATDLYSRLIPLVLGYFDVQACGPARCDVRADCHLDDSVAVGGPRDGEPIDASGGWHDAGDYMKFVETTSYVTALMLFAHDEFGDRFPPAPAPGKLPPLLRQARVGLEWLLKMHPTPDEFYYQVGDASDHESWRLPESDCSSRTPGWRPRQLLHGAGANLAGRTAAAFAIAARAYQPYDRRFAATLRRSAASAYAIGLLNPAVLTTDPADFYPETTWHDDMEWGAVELFRTTGRPEYREEAIAFSMLAGPAHAVTSVYNTHAIAHYRLHPLVERGDQGRLLDYLRVDAENARDNADNPYGLAAAYQWGTAEAAAGAAISCLVYASLSRENAFVDLARRQRDFILGCNPFGLSCLIGAGSRYPLFPHHQIANIKNIELSGALVGGPADFETFRQQNITLTDPDFAEQTQGPTLSPDRPGDAEVYHDAVQDYVTNEPANDYTAKFLLLAAFYGATA